jgi:hypothetical protein
MSAIHGVVRGNVVVLPEDAALPDGLRVEVRPLVPLAHPDAIEVEGRFKQQLVESRNAVEWVRSYVDTSALVKRYAREKGTTSIEDLTDPNGRHDIYTVILTGAELVAALFRRVCTISGQSLSPGWALV